MFSSLGVCVWCVNCSTAWDPALSPRPQASGSLCVCVCVCVWSVTSECLKRECHGDGGTWWGGHRVGGWVSERPQRKRGLGWWLISGEAMSLSSPDGKLFDVLMSNTHACTHMYTTHTHTHVHYTHTSTQTHMCTHTHTYTHKGTYLCEWTHIRYFHIHAPLIHTVETQLHTHMPDGWNWQVNDGFSLGGLFLHSPGMVHYFPPLWPCSSYFIILSCTFMPPNKLQFPFDSIQMSQNRMWF